jgi:hypothetical protein
MSLNVQVTRMMRTSGREQQEDPLDRHKGTGRQRKKHDRALHSFAKAAKSAGDAALCVVRRTEALRLASGSCVVTRGCEVSEFLT